MRTNCKSCKSILTKQDSSKSGAHHVYCESCDRQTARERMRKLRADRRLAKANDMYFRSKHGSVYIVYNPSFVGWIKVGCALSSEDRLKSFQTATPFRNFKIKWSKQTNDKLASEAEAHTLLSEHAERRNEWFKIQPHKASKILEKLQWQN